MAPSSAPPRQRRTRSVPGLAGVAAGSLSLAGAVALPATPPLLATAPLLLAIAPPAQAQEQIYLRKPGSKVGKESEVKAKNCTTSANGTINCDTEIVNPPGITPAKPVYNPFNN